jgi:hypothetical protein
MEKLRAAEQEDDENRALSPPASPVASVRERIPKRRRPAFTDESRSRPLDGGTLTTALPLFLPPRAASTATTELTSQLTNAELNMPKRTMPAPPPPAPTHRAMPPGRTIAATGIRNLEDGDELHLLRFVRLLYEADVIRDEDEVLQMIEYVKFLNRTLVIVCKSERACEAIKAGVGPHLTDKKVQEDLARIAALGETISIRAWNASPGKGQYRGGRGGGGGGRGGRGGRPSY